MMNRNSSSDAQACAVCRYQRRKCSPDCILAPFFPPNKPSDFLNAHRLFGVSNILKILRPLHDPHTRSLAVNSIIYHSNVRALDPVAGCYGIITRLHRDIFLLQTQLNIVTHHLARCRSNNYHLPLIHPNGFGRSPLNPQLLHASHSSSSQVTSTDDLMKPFVGDKLTPALPNFDRLLISSGANEVVVGKEAKRSDDEGHGVKNAEATFFV